MTEKRHCQVGFHSCDMVILLQERIAELEGLVNEKPEYVPQLPGSPDAQKALDQFQLMWNACITLHDKAAFKVMVKYIIELEGRRSLALDSRQLAEQVFESAKTAFSERDAEPEDIEGAIQEIEGILEREANVRPDLKLKAEREKNEQEGRSL